jgi:dihydrofolate reductase
MARFVFGMNVSLDGYVDHDAFAPGALLFRHWIENTRGLTGSIYGRRLYEIMAYWDEDQAGWGADHRAFAEAWRAMPKWVVSRSLKSVGPNASLIEGDLETALRKLKAQDEGEIDVGGPVLAHSVAQLGLIDEYRLYYRPFVLGKGNPFFQGALPPLRLAAHERIGEDAVRLTYVPV